MRIFLMGFMGSGKSTIGKHLAPELLLDFTDLDNYIIKKHNKNINEIFEQEGEQLFRIYERRALHDMFLKKNCIVGLGGGTPCFFDNVKQINENGVSFYFKLKPETLITRLRHAQSERPLIKGKTQDELLAFVQKMITMREKFYNQATHVLDCDTLTLADEIKFIMENI